jgi:hypothetical protein
MLPSVMGSIGSLRCAIWPAYRAGAALVERTSIPALNLLPMIRDQNLMGPNKGRADVSIRAFAVRRQIFLVWTDWNGPQLSWALCLSDWRLGWSSHVERYEACSQQWVCLPRTNRWLCSGYWAEEVASVVEASSMRSIEGAVSMVSLRFR